METTTPKAERAGKAWFDPPRKGPQSYLLSELLDVRESEFIEEESAWKQDAARDVADCEIEDAAA